MVQAFGKVVSSKILVDPKTGASKCAGFLRFTLPEEAARAIHEMNGKQVRILSLMSTSGHRTLVWPPMQRTALAFLFQPASGAVYQDSLPCAVGVMWIKAPHEVLFPGFRWAARGCL